MRLKLYGTFLSREGGFALYGPDDKGAEFVDKWTDQIAASMSSLGVVFLHAPVRVIAVGQSVMPDFIETDDPADAPRTVKNNHGHAVDAGGRFVPAPHTARTPPE